MLELHTKNDSNVAYSPKIYRTKVFRTCQWLAPVSLPPQTNITAVASVLLMTGNQKLEKVAVAWC